MSDHGPTMMPYRHHIFICTGRYCTADGEGAALYRLLPRLLAEHDLLFSADRVKRGETPCLGVCQDGPIAVIYPEGLWYHHVTPELLRRIVREHLCDGNPIPNQCFHSLSRPLSDDGEQKRTESPS